MLLIVFCELSINPINTRNQKLVHSFIFAPVTCPYLTTSLISLLVPISDSHENIS